MVEDVAVTLLTEPRSVQAVMGIFICIIIGLSWKLWTFALKANDQAHEAAVALASQAASTRDVLIETKRALDESHALHDRVRYAIEEHSRALRALETEIRSVRGH